MYLKGKIPHRNSCLSWENFTEIRKRKIRPRYRLVSSTIAKIFCEFASIETITKYEKQGNNNIMCEAN